MPIVLFLATLFCLLPSFLSVSVISLLHDGPFCQISETSPCYWSDGGITMKESKVYISVGRKSSLLAISNIQHLLSKVNANLELSEPDYYVFIVTENDGKDHSLKEHTDFIKKLAHETLYEVGIDAYKRYHDSPFDVSILKTIKLYPENDIDEIETFFNSDEIINTTVAHQILNPDNESIHTSKDSSPIEEASEQEKTLVNNSNKDTLEPTEDIENPNLLVNETSDEETLSKDDDSSNDKSEASRIEEDDSSKDQPSESLIEEDDSDEDPPLPSNYQVKGAQFKFKDSNDPMIYGSKAGAKTPDIVNSRTGEIHRANLHKRQPFVGKIRIPDDSKLLIVKKGNRKIYYKNITSKSKVWYLEKKVFYPCIVENFSRPNPIPTLKCIGHTPEVVPKVEWKKIFPIESTDLINELGKFRISPKNIKWDTIIRPKQTPKTKVEKLEVMEEQDSSSEKNDSAEVKSQKGDDRSEDLSQASLIEEDSAEDQSEAIQIEEENSTEDLPLPSNYQVKGAQFKFKDSNDPMIYCSKSGTKKPDFINSRTGKICQLDPKRATPFTGKTRIPDETKMLIVKKGNRKIYYKIITLKSKVWYLDKKVFYPCIVESLSRANPVPTLKCISHKPVIVPKVEWEKIFPIESTDLINELGKFRISPKNIKWDTIIRPKQTPKTKVEKLEVMEEQDSSSEENDSADDQPPPSNYQVNGAQFKFKGFDDPMIYGSKAGTKDPLFVNSRTGDIHRLNPKRGQLATGNNRIPDDTKLLIVKKGMSKIYYKNMTLKSKVWYLEKKVFYPCIVENFSRANPLPTLKCIGHTLEEVPNVEWKKIFPIESTDLIKELGKFKIKRKDVNWDELGNEKEKHKPHKPEKLEELEEQDISSEDDDSAEDQPLPSNYQVKGEQFKFIGYDYPMIYCSFSVAKHPDFVDSRTGKLYSFKLEKGKLATGKTRIPDDTKMLIVKKGMSKIYYKNITSKSKVWYLEEKVLYPCIVESLSRGNPSPTLKCIGHTPEVVPKVEWEKIFPIESTEMIKEMGEFKIKSKDIKWEEISKQKKTSKSKSKELKEVNEQDSSNEDDDSAENQSQDKTYFVKGSQYKVGEFEEPWICTSKTGMKFTVFVNSLTGQVRQFRPAYRPPFTGENRIPDDTKLVIVKKGNQKLYYKNITTNSKVWYLNGKIFYPCLVLHFGLRKNNKISLNCIGHDPSIVDNVEWKEIFPMESTDLIRDLGEFSVQPEDIKWDEMSNRRNTRVPKPEKRGEQHFYKDSSSPYLFHSINVNQWIMIDSESGAFRSSTPGNWTKLSEDDPRRIPDDTKMTADKKFKIILPQSKVLYHCKEKGVLIEGFVHFFSTRSLKPTIRCINGQDYPKAEWDDIYPIESYELIKDLAPRWKPEASKANKKKRGRKTESKDNNSKKKSAGRRKKQRIEEDEDSE